MLDEAVENLTTLALDRRDRALYTEFTRLHERVLEEGADVALGAYARMEQLGDLLGYEYPPNPIPEPKLSLMDRLFGPL